MVKKLLKLQKQDQLYFLVVSSLILLKTSWKKVKLSTNEQFQTLITSGHSEFNLSGLDPDQYPLLPEVSRDDAIQLSVKVLKISLHKLILQCPPQKHDQYLLV